MNNIIVGGDSILRIYNPSDFSFSDIVLSGEVTGVYGAGNLFYAVLYNPVTFALTYVYGEHHDGGSTSYEVVSLGSVPVNLAKKPSITVVNGSAYVIADVIVGGSVAISTVVSENRVDIASDMSLAEDDRLEITSSLLNDGQYVVDREDGLSLFLKSAGLDTSDNSGYVSHVQTTLFKIDQSGAVYSTGLRLVEAEIIGSGNRGIIIRHTLGTSSYYWREASLEAELIGSMSNRLSDIIKHRGFMFGISQNGLYGYRLSEELFLIEQLSLNIFVDKIAVFTNGTIIGYSGEDNKVVTIDPLTGDVEDFASLNDYYSISSITAPDQVVTSGISAPLSVGTSVIISSAPTGSNNGSYIVTDNTGHPTYKIAQSETINSIISPDTVMLAGIMDKLSPGDNVTISGTTLNDGNYTVKMVYGAKVVLNTTLLSDETPAAASMSKTLTTDASSVGDFVVVNSIGNMAEYTCDRYSRFTIVDDINNVITYGNSSGRAYLSVLFQITSSGKNMTGMDYLFFNEPSGKYHTELDSDDSFFEILESMSAKDEGASVIGYLGSEKLFNGESLVYTDRYVLGVSISGNNNRSFTSPSEIKSLVSDSRYVWVMGEKEIWVLSIDSLSLSTVIDITKNNSAVAFPAPDTIDFASDPELMDGSKIYITGANTPANDGEWIIKSHVAGSSYKIYTSDKSFVVDAIPGGSVSIYNLGIYIGSFDDNTVAVFNSNFSYDIYGFSGTIYKSDYLEYPDAGSTGESVNIASSTAPNTFAFDHDPGWNSGDSVEVVGTAANDGIYTVSSNVGASYVMVEAVVTAGVGGSAIRLPLSRLKISDVPKYDVDAKNMLVPISNADSAAYASVPSYLRINRGGLINYYSDIMVPWNATYKTRVIPLNLGYTYLITDLAGTTVLHEIDPSLVVTPIPLNGVDYGAMSVGPYYDLMVFKKDDVASNKGLMVFLRNPGISILGDFLKYDMSSDFEIEGSPGKYLGVESVNNAMGYSVGEGNFMSNADVQSWAAFDYKSGTLKFIVTGTSFDKSTFLWDVSVKLLIDNSQELVIYLSPINQSTSYSGDGVYSAVHALGFVPSVVIAEFIIEDKYSGSIIKKHHILTFGRR